MCVFLMLRRQPGSRQGRSSAASEVDKRQVNSLMESSLLSDRVNPPSKATGMLQCWRSTRVTANMPRGGAGNGTRGPRKFHPPVSNVVRASHCSLGRGDRCGPICGRCRNVPSIRCGETSSADGECGSSTLAPSSPTIRSQASNESSGSDVVDLAVSSLARARAEARCGPLGEYDLVDPGRGWSIEGLNGAPLPRESRWGDLGDGLQEHRTRRVVATSVTRHPT